MSEHRFPRYPREAMLYALEEQYLRHYSDITTTPTEIVLTYLPDLTTAEADRLTSIVRYGRADTSLTLDEYLAVEPTLAIIRTQRLRTDAQWNALTAAQRDAQLIAWDRAITDLLRALLRD